ncbi:tetratricopeptide repeat protein [candidate division KSB1 bacterium]|nr:tetratricopeptide repeat protein [candidate division KSB1 bacterium]
MLKPRKRLTKKQIKEDKLVTYYFKAIDYINENSKIVFGIIIGIIAIVALLYMYSWSKENAEMSASLELTKAREELKNTQPERATDILRSMINNYSGTKSAGRGVYHLANIMYSQSNYDEAFNYYKKYIDDYNDDPILASSSYSGMGACMEQKEEFLKAAEYYKKGAQKFSKNFEAPRQLMAAARCYKLANNRAEAEKMYQKVIDKYPDSAQKRDAELFLSELQG